MIGFQVEKNIGTWKRYVLFLLIGSIGGNLLSAAIDPYNFGVGASVCLFSVLANLCVWFLANYD